MNWQNLSFITAVYNEEENLPSLHKHLKPYLSKGAQWIVIIDFRNTDKSAQIVKKFGARVLVDKGESKGIVFLNKNKGIEAAKTPWLFIIDADERMDKVLAKEVEEIINQTKNQFDIFETGFINLDFGKPLERSDLKNKTFVRLFKKGTFYYDVSKTSEGFYVQKFLGKSKKLKGKLIHNSHPTISTFIKKIDRYSSREAKFLIKKVQKKKKGYLAWKIVTAPVIEFFRKYVLWKLWKEGIHGLIASSIFAVYHFLIWAKTYELYFKLKNRNQIKNLYKKWNFNVNE